MGWTQTFKNVNDFKLALQKKLLKECLNNSEAVSEFQSPDNGWSIMK